MTDDKELGWDKTTKEHLGSNLFYQLSKHPNLISKPACFLEVAYIDNPRVDDALLKDGKWKTTFPAIAKAIGDQLIRWHTAEAGKSN